jgi:hypothetical protein
MSQAIFIWPSSQDYAEQELLTIKAIKTYAASYRSIRHV